MTLKQQFSSAVSSLLPHQRTGLGRTIVAGCCCCLSRIAGHLWRRNPLTRMMAASMLAQRMRRRMMAGSLAGMSWFAGMSAVVAGC